MCHPFPCDDFFLNKSSFFFLKQNVILVCREIV